MGEEFGRKFRSLGRRLSLVTTRVKGEGRKKKPLALKMRFGPRRNDGGKSIR